MQLEWRQIAFGPSLRHAAGSSLHFSNLRLRRTESFFKKTAWVSIHSIRFGFFFAISLLASWQGCKAFWNKRNMTSCIAVTAATWRSANKSDEWHSSCNDGYSFLGFRGAGGPTVFGRDGGLGARRGDRTRWWDLHREIYSRGVSGGDHLDLRPFTPKRGCQGVDQCQEQTFASHRGSIDDKQLQQSFHAQNCQRSKHFTCKFCRGEKGL